MFQVLLRLHDSVKNAMPEDTIHGDPCCLFIYFMVVMGLSLLRSLSRQEEIDASIYFKAKYAQVLKYSVQCNSPLMVCLKLAAALLTLENCR